MDELNLATQNADVLDCMKRLGYITDDIARDQLGVHRLSARICDLRGMGVNIQTVMRSGKNRHGHTCRYAQYFLG